MRILKVRFKNLNSLTGEWEIDFTNPAFSSGGIFAITGPTGAGKSTILDAICLSLYGRTPRLSKVTKSSNEIMSRQTGECFAETVFETQSGRFKCNWSQRRARKKPDGELQIPKHEISDPDSSKILDTSLKGVADQVTSVTGMDFDRFTRSMLLAQGGFAAFLQASPDERSPILEDITGTGIYSRISMMVHERKSEERSRLDLLQAEIKGIQLLAEEDENDLKKQLEQKKINAAEIEGLIARNKQSIIWLEGIARLEKEILSIESLKNELGERSAAFQPEKEKLARALKALELAADHKWLASLRKTQENDLKNLDQSIKIIPEAEERLKTAEMNVDSANIRLDKDKEGRNEALEVIKKVRELDVLIREKNAPIKEIDSDIAEIKKSIGAYCIKSNENQTLLIKKKESLESIAIYQKSNMYDGALVESLAGIKEKFENIKSLDAISKAKNKEALLSTKKKEEAQNQLSIKEKAVHKLKNELELLESSSSNINDDLLKLLSGKDLSQWRDELIFFKDRYSLLENVKNGLKNKNLAIKGIEELQEKDSKLSDEKKALSISINELLKEQSVFEREINLLETQVFLLRKIESFEDARKNLQENQPCPLCGSLDHPFASGNMPIKDEALKALEDSKRRLNKTSSSLSKAQIKNAEISTEIIQNSARLKELEEKLAEICALFSAPDKAFFNDMTENDLLILIQKTDDGLKASYAIITEAEAMQKNLAEIQANLEKTRKILGASELELNTALNAKKNGDEEHGRIAKELSDLSAQIEKLTCELTEILSDYSISAFSLKKADSIFSDLVSRRDRWLEHEKNRHDLEKSIIFLEQDIIHVNEQTAKLENDLKIKNESLEKLISDLKSLSDKRLEIFGEKDPDNEEKRLNRKIEDSEKNLEEAQKSLNLILQEHENLKTRINELEKVIIARKGELKTSEDGFNNRLARYGFIDEKDYVSSSLSENDRNIVAEKAERLSKEQSELDSRYKNCTTQLESEKLKKNTERSYELLVDETSDIENSLKNLQHEIGAIHQKIDDNELMRQKQQDRIENILAQKKECARWDKLHELIGSSDGKKYRNFVQGLTFEIMVRHANRQLQKMTDRYLLVRDRKEPLDLNVIDSYQAGEIRSTKNLSGGESFVVSLSLALGLSNMSSRNVRVDSLFLDEGFGTLDEDALDTALETLSGLHEGGKLIGVISHVHGLKERISTQIQVLPMTGGRSTINGPGCLRVSKS